MGCKLNHRVTLIKWKQSQNTPIYICIFL